jgi:hypothetical protein
LVQPTDHIEGCKFVSLWSVTSYRLVNSYRRF